MTALAEQVFRVFCDNEPSILKGRFCYRDRVPKGKVFYRPLLGEIRDPCTRGFINEVGEIPKKRMYDGSRKLYIEITYYRVIHGLLV
jgi:hypothetical protein